MNSLTINPTSKQKLMIAVIQAQDCEFAIKTLEAHAFKVTHLPSVGGFLGKRNVTLLIGTQLEKTEEVRTILEETCKKRVTYITIPVENAPLLMPMPTPVTIGGASIFSLDIEYWEDI